MCKLIVGIQDKKNTQDFVDLLAVQEEALEKERDGIGAMAIYDDGTVKVKRSLDDYAGVFNFAIDETQRARIIAIHSRTSSQGSRDLPNVHFFNHNGVYLAHNGFVSGYAPHYDYPKSYSREWNGWQKRFGYDTPYPYDYGQSHPIDGRDDIRLEKLHSIINSCKDCAIAPDGYCFKHAKTFEEIERLEALKYGTIETQLDDIVTGKEEKKKPTKTLVPTSVPSDTLLFLRHLPKTLNIASLTAQMDKDLFTGMAFAYDKKTKKSFLMVRTKPTASAVIKDGEFSAFFSYVPKTRATFWGDAEVNHGVSITGSKRMFDVGVETKNILEGVFELV
jgi:hypothetical protein